MTHISDLGQAPQWFVDLMIDIKEAIRVDREKFISKRSLYAKDLDYSPSESVLGVALLKSDYEIIYAGRRFEQRSSEPEKEFIIYKDNLDG